MNHTPLMGGLEAQGYLAGQSQGLRQGQDTTLELAFQGRREELHSDEVGIGVLAYLVDGNDIRMDDGGGQAARRASRVNRSTYCGSPAMWGWRTLRATSRSNWLSWTR